MRCVAAIDPGKDKSGFAVLDAGGSTLFQCIVPTAAIPEQLTPQLLLHQPECLVLGNGTTSRQMQQCLQQCRNHAQCSILGIVVPMHSRLHVELYSIMELQEITCSK